MAPTGARDPHAAGGSGANQAAWLAFTACDDLPGRVGAADRRPIRVMARTESTALAATARADGTIVRSCPRWRALVCRRGANQKPLPSDRPIACPTARSGTLVTHSRVPPRGRPRLPPRRRRQPRTLFRAVINLHRDVGAKLYRLYRRRAVCLQCVRSHACAPDALALCIRSSTRSPRLRWRLSTRPTAATAGAAAVALVGACDPPSRDSPHLRCLSFWRRFPQPRWVAAHAVAPPRPRRPCRSRARHVLGGAPADPR